MIFSSCVSQKFGHVTSYLDYSRYSDAGFFITELQSVPFDYVPIGSISVREYSGNDNKEKTEQSLHRIESSGSLEKKDDIYERRTGYSSPSKWRTATATSTLNAAVEEAKSVGGNGLIALDVTTFIDTKTREVTSIRVSGMVIKRK